MPESKADGKVALVTGASSGIGRSTAVELAVRGYQVAIHYFHNEKGAHETFDAVRAIPGARARVYSCDVSDAVQVSQMAGDLLADFGRLDALVNNAGSLVARRPLTEMDFEHWRAVMGLNLDGVFLVTRAFLPQMIQQKSGGIVNVSSIAARNGGGLGASAYAAAKGAVLTLTRSWAKELIPYGIRVNCVNPGVIDTPFHERFSNSEMIGKFVAAIPQHRMGTGTEIAKVIAFLLSDDASFVLGEAVEANGGQLMD